MTQTLMQLFRIIVAIAGGFVIAWCLFVLLHIRLLQPALLMPACAVGVWWALPRLVPRFKSPTRSGPPMSVTTEGEWTIISARPSPMPKRGPILAVLVPAIPAGLFIAHDAIAFGIGVWVVLFLTLLYVIENANRRKRHGKEGPFGVKGDAVRLPSGEVLPSSRINRFGIRNTETGQVFYFGGNSIQRMGQVGAASTHARMLPISHAVVVEHRDGSMTFLAGGLTQELANAVLHEITRHVRGFAVT